MQMRPSSNCSQRVSVGRLVVAGVAAGAVETDLFIGARVLASAVTSYNCCPAGGSRAPPPPAGPPRPGRNSHPAALLRTGRFRNEAPCRCACRRHATGGRRCLATPDCRPRGSCGTAMNQAGVTWTLRARNKTGTVSHRLFCSSSGCTSRCWDSRCAPCRYAEDSIKPRAPGAAHAPAGTLLVGDGLGAGIAEVAGFGKGVNSGNLTGTQRLLQPFPILDLEQIPMHRAERLAQHPAPDA